MDFQRLFLTFFYSGLSPKAPGTVGTVAGLALGVVLLLFLPKGTLFTAALALFIVGVMETNKYEAKHDLHDPKEIVIDEVVGIWIVLAMVPFEWISIALGFLFFPLYDILKPSVIGRVDRKVKGGMGVMLDDVLAGFFAGISVLIVINAYAKLIAL